jgi:LSD1 subclass zinc finger protein
MEEPGKECSMQSITRSRCRMPRANISTRRGENRKNITIIDWRAMRPNMRRSKHNVDSKNCRSKWSIQSELALQHEDHHHERGHFQVGRRAGISLQSQKIKATDHVPNFSVRLVACYKCYNVQTVPSTTDTFRCGTCSNINECVPTFAFLRCYSCKSKVLYARGVSDFIKCTKCTTVNEVPREVKDVRHQMR